MTTRVASSARPVYVATRTYFQNSFGKRGSASNLVRLWRKAKATGMMSGNEKKATNGQMYSICGKWMVATWFSLSPIEVSEYHVGGLLGLTKDNTAVPDYKCRK